MNDRYQVVTPENVTIEFAIAGLGSRFLAIGIDMVIQTILTAGIFWGFTLLGLEKPSLGSELKNLTTSTLGAVLITLLGVVWLGYYIILETALNGQTIGKKFVNIRVRKEPGDAAGFWEILLRNLIRPVDFLPTLYGIGFLVIFINKKSKRLGDFAAGTIVVKELPRAKLTEFLNEKQPQITPKTSMVFADQYPWAGKILANLTQSDYLLIHNYLTRRKLLTNSHELAAIILRKLSSGYLGNDSLVFTPANAENFLEELVAAYENSHDLS